MTLQSRRKINRSCALQVFELLVGFLLFVVTKPSFGQKADSRPATTLDPVQGEKEARTLVADLLAKKPEENTTSTGVLRIRDGEGKRREIPVRFEVAATANGWVSTYETLPQQAGAPCEKLKVIHNSGQPNEYSVTNTGQAEKKLTPDQLMAPFAGSDFWIADLGLEFLHWPKQRIVQKEMRRSCYCQVLESIAPSGTTNGYVRVVSWIDSDSGGIVNAEAYDSRNQVLKVFAPTQLKKIEGQRQLEEMEMRNKKTGSHSWVKYNLE